MSLYVNKLFMYLDHGVGHRVALSFALSVRGLDRNGPPLVRSLKNVGRTPFVAVVVPLMSVLVRVRPRQMLRPVYFAVRVKWYDPCCMLGSVTKRYDLCKPESIK